MDTRIPLMGVQPDLAASLTNGLHAGMLQRQAQQQNSLAQLYQAQGPQIMAGDPGALNSLAQFDPTAAMGIQSQRMGMQTQQFNMDQARVETAQAAQAAAAKLSADQLAAKTAEAEATLSGAAPIVAAMKAGDPTARQRLAGYLQSHNIAATPDNVEELMFRSHVAVDALKAAMANQPKPEPAPAHAYRAATPEESAQYGAAAGQIDSVTGEFTAHNPPSGMKLVSDGAGGFTLEQGSWVTGSAAKPLTESEGKNSGFLIRMKDSGAILDKLENQGTDLGSKALSLDPTGLSNYALSTEYQQYDQAKRDFLNAVLRRESGAVISPGEFANAEQQYFPQPGNPPEVIAQKRKNRENAIAGVAVGSGKGLDNPIVKGSGATNDYTGMSLKQLTGVDVMTLDMDGLTAFEAALAAAKAK